jgi:L-alanine-DL-glutamate epimerase-like enolase superfamily enzyme
VFPDDKVLNFRRLLDRQIEVRAGELQLPSDPGLGFDFDEDAVRRFAVADWHSVDKGEK